jgi:hypothetical protein
MVVIWALKGSPVGAAPLSRSNAGKDIINKGNLFESST